MFCVYKLILSLNSQMTERENHTAGVNAVLNLCDVLLSDRDACPTATETRAIEQARDSLRTRWGNIHGLAAERRAT